MDQEQVDIIGLKSLQALVDRGPQAYGIRVGNCGRTAVGIVTHPFARALGNKNDVFPYALKRLSHQRFAVAPTVDGRGVEQRYTVVKRCPRRGNRLVVVEIAVHTPAHWPAAVADYGSFKP